MNIEAKPAHPHRTAGRLAASVLTLIAPLLVLSSPAHAQLSGDYTVGTGGDFATISEAVDTLNSVGRAGAITFNILDGTYEEQFMISSHDGVSEDHPVIFQPSSGNLGDVKIAFEATSSSDNYVVSIQGTSYITFQKIYFSALGNDFGTIFYLQGGSYEGVSILDNHFEGADVQSSQQQFAIVRSTAALAIDLHISRNTFQNGSNSIYVRSGSQGFGTLITDNVSSGAAGDAIYLVRQSAPVVSGNSISHSGNFYALRVEECSNALRVVKNRIDISGGSRTGIYLRLSEGDTNSEEGRGLIANNFFTVRHFDGGRSAIYILQSEHHDILYNSINVINPNAASQGLHLSGELNADIRILNNSFSNTGHSFQTHLPGGSAIRVDDPGAVTEMDYNNIFSTGNYIAKWGALDIMDIETLKVLGNEGRNANSISILPHYASNDDLRTLSPWMAQRALPLDRVVDDIDGEPRDESAPTIGAAEYRSTSDAPMNGTYTIGSGGAYASFHEAVDDLLLRGIGSDVTFDVLPGVYDEQITLFEVPAIDRSDRVTFRSQTGDASDVTLHYEAESDIDNYVVHLRSARNVTFEHLTLASNTASDGLRSRIIVIQGYTHDVRLRNNVFNGTGSTSSGSPDHAIIHSEPALTNGLSITFNSFNGGGYAAYLIGPGQLRLSNATVLSDNEVTSSGYMAFRLENQLAPLVRGNIIGPGVQGIYLVEATMGSIIENRIRVGGLSSGITLFRSAGGEGAQEQLLVANNFITHTGGNNSLEAGIEIIDSQKIDVVYNSVNSQGPLSPAFYLRTQGLSASLGETNVMNNVFSNTGGGYALQILAPAAITESDHNDIYTSNERFAYWDGEMADLSALQQASGKDLNSISADPEFVSSTDLHARSAALDSAGTPLENVLVDIDGDTRDAVFPDIGADEFDFQPIALTAPELRDPPDGSENIPTMPRLHWTAVEGASSYSVEVDLEDSFETPVVSLSGVTTNSVLLESNLDADTEYAWRVRAAGDTGVSEWSATGIFGTVPTASRVIECDEENPVATDEESGLEISFDELSECGEVVVTHVDEAPDVPDHFVIVIPRRWIIETRGLDDFSVSICFDLSDVADQIGDETLIRILRRADSGADWEELETEWQEELDRVCVHDLSSFGEFGIVRPSEQVSTETADLPETFALHANYPNPFNPATVIRFSMARTEHLRLTVLDMLGREVVVLVDGPRAAGDHEVTWDASAAASGVYLYRMEVDGFTRTRRMALVR